MWVGIQLVIRIQLLEYIFWRLRKRLSTYKLQLWPKRRKIYSVLYKNLELLSSLHLLQPDHRQMSRRLCRLLF